MLTTSNSVFLYVIYFPTEGDMSSSTASITQTSPPKRRDAVLVSAATLLSIIVTLAVSLAILFGASKYAQSWANILGTVAGVLSGVQYLPQIWYTYQMGDIKSLSIETMIIQVPGAFLFALSLWLRVGLEGWATWLVYIITGILQGVLLGLAITYWVAKRRKDRAYDDAASSIVTEDWQDDHTEEVGEEASENTALLSNGGKGSKSRPVKAVDKRSASQRALDVLYKASPRSIDSSD